jgi:hypothetical protein
MHPDFYKFAVWSTFVVGAAVIAILFQHSQHTAFILSKMPADPSLDEFGEGEKSPNNGDDADETGYAAVSSNPNWSGASSTASGQWTPLGPPGNYVFSYTPAQNQVG